jgi:hypothetical protein
MHLRMLEQNLTKDEHATLSVEIGVQYNEHVLETWKKQERPNNQAAAGNVIIRIGHTMRENRIESIKR